MVEPVLCEVCRRRPAIGSCRLCGRRVCSEHYDGERGICSVCSETLCMLCGRRLAVASCSVCGRLVCEECSVQVNPVVRLCRDCARRYRDWPPRELVEDAVSRLRSSLSSLLSVPR